MFKWFLGIYYNKKSVITCNLYACVWFYESETEMTKEEWLLNTECEISMDPSMVYGLRYIGYRDTPTYL